MSLAKVILRPGRDKSLLRKHPWIFSGAIQSIVGEAKTGETIIVQSAEGKNLGKGAYNPASQISVRIWSLLPDEDINDAFMKKKINQAIELRLGMPSLAATNSKRLIFAENDGLPGVIADQYGDIIVLQLSTAGAFFWRETVIHEIVRQTGCACLYEKSDNDVNRLEGLKDVNQVQYGQLPDSLQMISEHGLEYSFSLAGGQKTGFYLDQRQNRLALQEFSSGKRVLDCFCFSGGFTMNALRGGAAQVTAVDSSAEALQLLRLNINHNHFDQAQVETLCGNGFEVLRKMRDKGQQFDLIILDPPKFAPTTAQLEKAARAYKDINLLGFKLLAPGGTLFTFSCSGGVEMSLFQKIVADAVLDAGKEAQIIRILHQAEDHPVRLSFPEGKYLKGLVCKISS